jgi:hypothetical protein
MPLKPALLKFLNKPYEPNTLVELRFKGLDASVRTDAEGRPFHLFLGKRGPDGRIRGERYMRHLVHDATGTVIKDHWDRKGWAS